MEISDPRKPKTLTPVGFTELAAECVRGAGLPITTLGRRIRVAPKTLYLMAKGDFARQDFEAMLRGGIPSMKRRPKLVRGSFSSLSRFCSYFDLDLESCALACGFPKECLGYVDSYLHTVSWELVPTTEELAKVQQVVDLTGPISLREIGSAVMRMRENGKSS